MKYGVRRTYIWWRTSVGFPPNGFQGRSRWEWSYRRNRTRVLETWTELLGSLVALESCSLWTVSLRMTLEKRACIAATDGLRAGSQVAGHHASMEDPSRCDGASKRRIKGPFRAQRTLGAHGTGNGGANVCSWHLSELNEKNMGKCFFSFIFTVARWEREIILQLIEDRSE